MLEQKQIKRAYFTNQIQRFFQNRNSVDLSLLVVQNLSHLNWKEGSVIAGFYPLKHEVDLQGYMENHSEYLFAYPTSQYEFKFVNSQTSFEKRTGDFLEPVSNETCPVEQIDIFLLPCLGLDRKGTRLGRGKGFYDRILAQNSKAITLAVAWDIQVEPSLPQESHDVSIDGIVTQSWSLFFNSFFEKRLLKAQTNKTPY